MNNIKLNHQNFLNKSINYGDIKQLKQNSLINCFSIKHFYSDQNKKLLDKISIKMQKLLNQGELTINHFESFILEMKSSGIKSNDCEIFLMNMLNIIKHNTSSDTKINWFGNVNKTNSLQIFLNNNLPKLENVSQDNLQHFLHLHYKAHIFDSIGIIYHDLYYQTKAFDCFHKILNKYNDKLDSNSRKYYKTKFFEQSNQILSSVSNTQNT